MFVRVILTVFLIASGLCSVTAQQQPPPPAKVAQQVERIKLISGHSEFGYGELPGLFPPDDSGPVPQLIKYGMDAIPDLIPYLADKSFTNAWRVHSSGVTQRARVNEYIILVINRITEHNFYLPQEQSAAARS